MVPTQIDEDRVDFSVADVPRIRPRYSLLDAKPMCVLILTLQSSLFWEPQARISRFKWSDLVFLESNNKFMQAILQQTAQLSPAIPSQTGISDLRLHKNPGLLLLACGTDTCCFCCRVRETTCVGLSGWRENTKMWSRRRTFSLSEIETRSRGPATEIPPPPTVILNGRTWCETAQNQLLSEPTTPAPHLDDVQTQLSSELRIQLEAPSRGSEPEQEEGGVSRRGSPLLSLPIWPLGWQEQPLRSPLRPSATCWPWCCALPSSSSSYGRWVWPKLSSSSLFSATLNLSTKKNCYSSAEHF